MLSEERRRSIVESIGHEGRALVKDLSSRFRVSPVTIRKDLEVLHSQGCWNGLMAAHYLRKPEH
jgi:DeoR/GlpR family transcriptional regulator of sugar metabolism